MKKLDSKEKKDNKNIEKIAERLAEIFIVQIESQKNKDKNVYKKRGGVSLRKPKKVDAFHKKFKGKELKK